MREVNLLHSAGMRTVLKAFPCEDVGGIRPEVRALFYPRQSRVRFLHSLVYITSSKTDVSCRKGFSKYCEQNPEPLIA